MREHFVSLSGPAAELGAALGPDAAANSQDDIEVDLSRFELSGISGWLPGVERAFREDILEVLLMVPEGRQVI